MMRPSITWRCCTINYFDSRHKATSKEPTHSVLMYLPGRMNGSHGNQNSNCIYIYVFKIALTTNRKYIPTRPPTVPFPSYVFLNVQSTKCQIYYEDIATITSSNLPRTERSASYTINTNHCTSRIVSSPPELNSPGATSQSHLHFDRSIDRWCPYRALEAQIKMGDGDMMA